MSTSGSFADYRAIDAINWSTLKHMADSPLHYRYHRDHPTEDTTRLLLGRAVHTAVLEPDLFPLQYVVWDGDRRAGKEWQEFAAVNANRGVLKASEYRLCLDVRDAVRSRPSVVELLSGESEITRTWTDPATGLRCKARPDHLGHALVDLKTTGTIDQFKFESLSARMLYHGQMAFYRRAVEEPRAPVYIIAVEIDPPHDVAAFEVDEGALEYGDRLVAQYLQRVKDCTEAGEWPGRYEDADEGAYLSLPAWMDESVDEGWAALR